MDLKTYAVYRKLTANSTLLEHLAKNEPVPIDVLENDIQELIASLHHAQAEQLVNDYPQYLQEHVQLGTIKNGENQFIINGEIEEPVIQSIELLHTVNRKDVVSNFITKTMKDLNGHREVKIENLSISEAADNFLELTKTPLFSDAQETLLTTDTTEIPPNSHVGPSEDIEPAETVMEAEYPDLSFIDDLPDFTTDNIFETDEPETVNPDLSFMNDELPPSNVKVEPPLFESAEDAFDDDVNTAFDDDANTAFDDDANTAFDDDANTAFDDDVNAALDDVNAALDDVNAALDDNDKPKDSVDDDDKQKDSVDDKSSAIATYKKAYDYLVDEIKALGLDKRLPNLHLA